jgi:hypothetical protein
VPDGAAPIVLDVPVTIGHRSSDLVGVPVIVAPVDISWPPLFGS